MDAMGGSDSEHARHSKRRRRHAEPKVTPLPRQISYKSPQIVLGTWCSGIECIGLALRGMGIPFVHSFAADTDKWCQAIGFRVWGSSGFRASGFWLGSRSMKSQSSDLEEWQAFRSK